MSIEVIHCYLVHPEKGSTDKTNIMGTSVPKSGNLFMMLKGIFDKAIIECTYNIAFILNDNGEQKNDCRNVIIQHIKKADIETGRSIALRLQSITTNRSGLGLLFIMLGKSDSGKRRIVLSRFPAETGILAEEIGQSLSVVFIEKVFMKNALAYKSAVFEGTSFDGEFWKGQAIDKQITADNIMAHYWINEFLQADFATTGERGTRSLALALRDAINMTKVIPVKEEIIASILLAKGMNKKLVSASSFVETFGLSDEAKEIIKKRITPKLYDEQFFFLTEEFHKHIKFKSIKLDNGAMLTADAYEFDTVFQRQLEDANKIKFSTTGKVIEEKIKKTNL
jgi:hypothetical protein